MKKPSTLRRGARARRRRRRLFRLLGLVPRRDDAEASTQASLAIITPVDAIATVPVSPSSLRRD